MKKHLTLLLLLCLSFELFAQDDNSNSEGTIPGMITDRPDATESPKTVPFKMFQIETGGLYSSNKDQGIKTELLNFNNTLLRYGLLEKFELRLAFAISETRKKTQNENAMSVI